MNAMKIHDIRTVAALAAMAIAGSQQVQGQVRTEFRDSAGIRIIENSRPPEGSRLDWRIGPEPLLSIGQVEGEEPYLFERVFGIEMLSDGRIVIGDDGAKELRVFDQQGNHLETWGGRGEGPGEFGGIQLWGMARLPGDSIMVWGFLWPELTVFGPDGQFARRFIPERAQWDSRGRMRHLVPSTVSGDGLILANQDILYMHPGLVEVWDAGGELRGSLGEHPGQEVIRHGGRDTDPVMFARYAFRRSWGDLFIINTNHRYEFRAFALDGSLARIVRLDHELRTPTRAHVAAYTDEELSWISSERADRLAERRRELRDMAVAEHLPAFSFVSTDALDHLWVYEYEAPGEETPDALVTVFDPEGRALGYFEIPEGMFVYEAGEDYILGKVRDELGVETVHIWSLDRGGR